MTTYINWRVGDVINIAASIDEFCGPEFQYIFANDINVTKSPDSCSVSYGTERGCGLHLDNVTLTFKLVKCSGSAEGKSCNPEIVYKTIQIGVCNMNYYKPKTRYYLLDWFKRNRPTWKVTSWDKKQLYAVYTKEMVKHSTYSAKIQDEVCKS